MRGDEHDVNGWEDLHRYGPTLLGPGGRETQPDAEYPPDEAATATPAVPTPVVPATPPATGAGFWRPQSDPATPYFPADASTPDIWERRTASHRLYTRRSTGGTGAHSAAAVTGEDPWFRPHRSEPPTEDAAEVIPGPSRIRSSLHGVRVTAPFQADDDEPANPWGPPPSDPAERAPGADDPVLIETEPIRADLIRTELIGAPQISARQFGAQPPSWELRNAAEPRRAFELDGSRGGSEGPDDDHTGWTGQHRRTRTPVLVRVGWVVGGFVLASGVALGLKIALGGPPPSTLTSTVPGTLSPSVPDTTGQSVVAAPSDGAAPLATTGGAPTAAVSPGGAGPQMGPRRPASSSPMTSVSPTGSPSGTASASASPTATASPTQSLGGSSSAGASPSGAPSASASASSSASADPGSVAPPSP